MKESAEDSQIRDKIRSIIKKLNIKYSAHTEPIYSQEGILSLRSITSLRKIGKTMMIRHYGKLPKQQLVDAIIAYPEFDTYISNCLTVLKETDWKFFRKVASVTRLGTEIDDFHEFLPAQNLGLLQCFYHEDKLWYVVPKEIKDVFRRLKKGGYVVEKEHYCLLNNYVVATVSLYGVISMEELIGIINGRIERKTDMDELKSVISLSINDDSEYRLWENYVVHYQFEEDGFKRVKELIKARRNKTMYVPSSVEFLRYFDPDYYEWTPQIEALRMGLLKFISDPMQVQDVIDEIHDACMAEVRTQGYFDVFNEAGIVFDGIEQMNELIHLVMEVHNNTRIWSNFGNTPNELFKYEKLLLRPLPSKPFEFPEAVGKNSLCPCGSGKKFKHCCGKPH